MIVMPERFVLPGLQAWWPDSAADSIALLRRRPVVTVRQCSCEVARELAPLSFRTVPFHTSVHDLGRDEDALWAALDTKSCRTEIRRAQRLGVEVFANDRIDESYELVSSFLRTYGSPLSRRAWSGLLRNADVLTARLEGDLLVAHVVLVDPTRRARLLFSATADRESSAHAKSIGPANRLLHWHEFGRYRALGVPIYDFGGVVLDPRSPMWSITRFKRSFGGDLVEERIVRLGAGRVLRTGFRAALALRRRWKADVSAGHPELARASISDDASTPNASGPT